MAFNPFRAFRKRQKTFLAVMAIMCMLLFVAGDVISGRKGNLLGSGKPRNNLVVTKLYGKKVTEDEVRLAREQHRLASQFMVQAAGDGIVRLNNQMTDLRKNMQSGSENITRLLALQRQQSKLFKTFIRYFAQTDDPNRQQLALQQMGPYLQFLLSNPRSELFQELRNGMGLIPIDDALDFMIMRHQADNLGITLTDASIKDAVKSLTFDEVDILDVAKSFMVRNRDQEASISHDLLFEAVGDLLRVILAKEALMGLPSEQASSLDLKPAGELKETTSLITPDEFWDFYKLVRTTRDIGILSLPVKDFLDRVKEKASEKDLEQLFNRFKDVEYSPTSNRPAFKEPRRVSLEWAGARSDSPEYKKFADEFVLAAVTSAPVNPWPAVALAYSFDKDYQENVKSNRIPRYDRLPYQLPTEVYQFPGSTYEPTFLTSPHEAANVAGTLASLAQGSPWAAVVTYEGAPIAREIQKRAAIASDFFLLGAKPWDLLVAVSLAHQKPKYVSLADVGGEATKKMKKSIAQDLVISNLTALKKEMDEKRTKNENVKDWLKEALPKFHFTSHVAMKKAESKYEMVDDPALKPLKETYLRLNTKSLDDTRGDPKAERFADSFFVEGPKYEPKDWPSYSAGGSPTTWASEEEPIVYWKTEDEKAYVPTFEAARANVEKAWRFREARKLARAQAERVAELAKATKGDPQKLKDLAAKEKAEFIELRSVARLHKASPTARADLNTRYEEFKFPESISMPRPNRFRPEEGYFAALPDRFGREEGYLAALAGLKDPGDTVVEGNEPENILYVSTLISKQEPTVAAFYDAYRNAKSEANRDVLLEEWLQSQKQKFRYEIMDQLRTEATPDFVDGRYNLNAEVRKRFQTRNEDTGE